MEDKSQKTEQATPKRKEKLAKDGKLPKSADVGAAAVLVSAAASFAFFGSSAIADVTSFSRRAFSLHETPLGAVRVLFGAITRTTVPFVASAMVAAATAGLVQTRGRITPKLLTPQWDRLNPLPRLKTLLPGKESALEIFKQLVKVAAIGTVVWRVVDEAMPAIVNLPSASPLVGAGTVVEAAGRVALHGGLAFVLVAVFDFWLAKRKFNEDNKMTKREIRDEHKESEGDPHIKARRRRKARELAAARAVMDVSKATVLVCNPTHIAVALRYVPGEDTVPITLGKSVDEVALKMRARARVHGIPIVENRPFARALYKHADPGKPIPVELYDAAAEVIAHVLRLRGAR
ncbi:MAG: EscU/YscU/HrcU family type III secretion system export apparatus switch protein [Myxococcota bacterium]